MFNYCKHGHTDTNLNILSILYTITEMIFAHISLNVCHIENVSHKYPKLELDTRFKLINNCSDFQKQFYNVNLRGVDQ
jgi:hypothetical protein